MKSLGLIEVESVAAAVDALDIMCKTADVEFVTWERKLGGRLVTIIVQGSVSAVTQAVESAVEKCIKSVAAHAVIANPHPELERIVQKSRDRLLKARGETEEKQEEKQVTPKKTPAKKTSK